MATIATVDELNKLVEAATRDVFVLEDARIDLSGGLGDLRILLEGIVTQKDYGLLKEAAKQQPFDMNLIVTRKGEKIESVVLENVDLPVSG